jgi:hypothetical protein
LIWIIIEGITKKINSKSKISVAQIPNPKVGENPKIQTVIGG